MSRAGSHILLFTGLLLVSTSGPFFICAGMDPLAIAFWRVSIAGVLFFGWGAITGNLGWKQANAGRIAAAGTLLGAHFALWFWAFDLTDYASNVLLLVVQPITAAVAGHRLGEPLRRSTLMSVLVALAGLAIIAGGDLSLGPRALFGDLVTMAGNVAITFFYALTREERRRTPLPGFMAIALGAAALVLLPCALLSSARLIHYPLRSWAWLAALVLVTTVAGHGVMNYVARHVRLFTLNVVIVLEPAIALALGAVLFHATLTLLQLAGGLVLGAAVVLGLYPGAGEKEAQGAVAELEGMQ